MTNRRGGAIKFLRRVLLGLLVAVVGIVALAALGTIIPNPSTTAFAEDAPQTRRILVISNTIHTDIAIPTGPDSTAAFAELEATGLPIQHPDARWLLFGWGGRSFYLETPTLADIKPGPLFRALTLDRSVMHVDVIGELVDNSPNVTTIELSEEAYAALLKSIARSFARIDGKVLPIEGYAFGTVDKFYEAEGAFNMLLGCNTWTARMLRDAGISTGLWNAIPPSLVASLHLFNSQRVQ